MKLMFLRLWHKTLLLLAAIAVMADTSPAATTLLAQGANWKYLDDGSDQGTAWQSPSFDDSAWASGPAELGYGDGDEATVVSYGSNSSNKYITTYFRRMFFVANVAAITSATFNILRDDGAVAYLNGTEIYRTNMPSGTITYTTLASVAIGGAGETAWYNPTVSTSLLREGANVLAVEIHQSGATSSDISFNASLIADAGNPVVREPYLNSGTSSSMIVRWRTSSSAAGRVRYGSASNALNSVADDATVTTDHAVMLSSLSADSRYYYNIGTTSNATTSNDAAPYFYTSPAAGTSKATRIWAIGDFGLNSAAQRRVYNAFRDVNQTTYTNVWLMLGDNAYYSGTDSEYQSGVFNIYADLFRKTCVWPTLGNHDGVSANSDTQSGAYYVIFALPKYAEAGGIASGTEAYYSFDFGRIHFICLDSEGSNTSVGGAMLTWLQSDLAATTQDWIIAFFHHPPYSKGSHDSDNPGDSSGKMTAMRQNALPILEAGGVDLVLSGHSHSYERSYLLNGHYGLSTSLTSAMKIDGGSGRLDASGAYDKPDLGPGANQGAVYSVVGSSGQISGGSLNHPAHYISLNTLGSMIIDVSGSQLDAKFIDDTGATQDYFTMRKGTVTPVVFSSFSAE